MDFVTNSSSSSFLICKRYLSDNQLDAIRYHNKLGPKLGLDYADTDPWTIEENDLYITGYTFLDNFSIGELFDIIKIDGRCVTWGDYAFNLPTEELEEKKEEALTNEDWEKYLREIKEDF